MKYLPVSLFILMIFLTACNEENKTSAPTEKKEPAKKTEKKETNLFGSGEGLSYKIIRERSIKTLKNDSLQELVSAWVKENKQTSIEELTDYILEITEEQLDFSFDKCSSDPEKLVTEKKANCVGYAAYFAALMNFALKETKMDNDFRCRHAVAKIYFDNTNLNALINDPFFKDHDFNIIENKKDKSKIAVDPSLSDYLGIKRVKLKD